MIARRGLLGMLALPVPGTALAQGVRRPRIGMLSAAQASDPVAFIHVRRYLAALGWRDGATCDILERHGRGVLAAVPALAADLVEWQADILLVTGYTEVGAARAAASGRIPIVFLQVADPVGTGLVASLARPGGTITGAATTAQLLWGKRIEMLDELLPPTRRDLALLHNPGNPTQARNLPDVEAHAARIGFRSRVVVFRGNDTMPAALEDAARSDAMLVPHDWVLFPRRREVVAFAAAARVPAVYENRFSPMIGGMASYGADLRENYRIGATYVDRILRGALPADLPVVLPTRMELVLNLAAIADLGLTVAPTLLARADEVIE
jgi:putative tryptophan/tyrosine transport system substrate-binding protein